MKCGSLNSSMLKGEMNSWDYGRGGGTRRKAHETA